MDDLDLKILRALAKDAQESFLSIAKRLDVSPKTVQTRFNKMVNKKIILQCSIMVDLSKLGYQGKAYLMISLEEGYDKEKIVALLQKKKNLFLVTEVMGGPYDVLAVAAIKDYQHTIDCILSVKNLTGVAHVDVDLTNETSFPVDNSYNSLINS